MIDTGPRSDADDAVVDGIGYGVGRLLERRRQELSLERGDVAKRTGLSAQTIHNVETGRTSPNVDTVRRMIEAMEGELVAVWHVRGTRREVIS